MRGTTLLGDALDRSIEGMPGSMQLRPGCIVWSLSGASSDADTGMVQGVVDWFKARAHVCEDMQNAGFGNRRPPVGEPLDSLDALIGAQLLGLQFDRDWASALILEWTLANGRIITQRLAHFGHCQIAALAPLVQTRVASVQHSRPREHFDDLDIRFGSDDSLSLGGYVADRLTVRSKPPRRP